jgi:hypothetical protein
MHGTTLTNPHTPYPTTKRLPYKTTTKLDKQLHTIPQHLQSNKMQPIQPRHKLAKSTLYQPQYLFIYNGLRGGGGGGGGAKAINIF